MLILSIFLNQKSSRVLSEKNVFKLDAEFEMFNSVAKGPTFRPQNSKGAD
jgi:hypothetical protein